MKKEYIYPNSLVALNSSALKKRLADFKEGIITEKLFGEEIEATLFTIYKQGVEHGKSLAPHHI